MSENVAVPTAGGAPLRAPRSSQVRQWGSLRDLSSPTSWENALADRPFERMPWLAVALLCGSLLWFGLNTEWQWFVIIGLCGFIAAAAMMALSPERHPFVRTAIVSVALVIAAGIALAWARSELVGARPIGRPFSGTLVFQVLEREDPVGQGDRTRLLIATEQATGSSIQARVTLPPKWNDARLQPGSIAQARARLVPPSRAIVPGAYDPARRAWFDGIAASGTIMSQAELLRRTPKGHAAGPRQALSAHVRNRVMASGIEQSAAAIAATLLTGNRAGIVPADAQAMRDAGLAHLLSISGLHVGAVIALVWLLSMRGLALWPWLALRLPLPIVASVISASAGVGYTVLTGAALPTVRACLAALLVLCALALGRQALSLRLIAVAAITVLLFWPEAAISPSFQLSFAAVIAIVALHNAAPIVKLRENARNASALRRLALWAAMLFLTGLVIELTLFPLVLFHFHRSGLYGAAINLVAIPLTTFAILPVLMLALTLDAFGLGMPFWWLGGVAIEFLLDLARWTSAAPGSITFAPAMPVWVVICALAGGLWLALWSGRARLAGLLPLAAAFLAIALAEPPDVMVGREGRHVAINGEDGRTYLLRPGSGFNQRQLLELSGVSEQEVEDQVRSITEWPDAHCNRDFCALQVRDGAEGTSLLIARNDGRPASSALASACAQSDLVIAERPLGAECKPRWRLLDGRELARRGGALIELDSRTIRHVRPAGDGHGW